MGKIQQRKETAEQITHISSMFWQKINQHLSVGNNLHIIRCDPRLIAK